VLDNTIILQLVEKAQQGDQEAKSVLIEENSPLIKSVIKRFRDKGVEYDDLFQIGCMGFLKAIKNFNADFGVKFSTYVVPMVIGEIKRFMRDDGSIKVSRALKSLNLQINRYVEEFTQKNERVPTIEELAIHFEVDQQEIVLAMDSAKMPLSLYTPIEDESESLALIDRIEAQEDENSKMIDNIALTELVKHLDYRDRKIILLRYYFDKTQSEIAKELNISQVQVSRLENKILNNLRNKLTL
jgi:RNA polymerase sporulation-specific sigma factor